MLQHFIRNSRRRQVIAAALVVASGIGLSVAANAETVKVGMILTYSGPNAAIGEMIDRGAELYVQEHGKDLPPGVMVEIIRRDDTGPNPDVAKRLAQELILRDRVQILTGGQWTPNAMAVGALTKQAKVPFVVMAAAGSAVTNQSPYIIRTSMTLWQSSYPLGNWAAKNKLKTAYTVVSDFSPGHDGEAAFTKSFTEGGGKIIGSVRIPLKATDYLPYLQKVKEANPDVVYHFNPGGPMATAFMKAMSDIGIIGSKIKVIGPGDVTTDEELPSMGPAALGVVTAHHYSPAGKRKANETFVAAWKKAYGTDSVPNYFSVGGWDGMKAVFDAIRAQKGKMDLEKTMSVLSNWSNPESPRGPIRIDPATRDIVQHEYIRRVEQKNGRMENVEIETLPQIGDPWKELKINP